VGQAAIELVFDNAEGTLGGEYASYAEIAIRRTVSRDGLSHYYLNGTRCAGATSPTSSSAPASDRAATRSSSRA